jgi:hypothetical protein
MKNVLLCLGILLIATPFVLLCLYALTPWEPYRADAAFLAMLVSVGLGWLCIEVACEMRGKP